MKRFCVVLIACFINLGMQAQDSIRDAAPCCYISGRVVEVIGKESEGVYDCQVSLLKDGNDLKGRVKSDGDGYFRIGPVEAGKYTLKILSALYPDPKIIPNIPVKDGQVIEIGTIVSANVTGCCFHCGLSSTRTPKDFFGATYKRNDINRVPDFKRENYRETFEPVRMKCKKDGADSGKPSIHFICREAIGCFGEMELLTIPRGKIDSILADINPVKNSDEKGLSQIFLNEPENKGEVKMESFTCYPNPTSGRLHVKVPEGAEQLILMDARGKMLSTYNVRDGEVPTIDLSMQSAGIYIIQAIMDGRAVSTRVVLSR